MNVLEKVARNHTLWLKMVLNMGCNPSMAEDIVQQMYLRIDRLVKEGKNVMYDDESANRFYIYLTLKSMYIDYKRTRGKYTFFEIMDNDEVDSLTETPAYYAGMDMEEQEANPYDERMVAKSKKAHKPNAKLPRIQKLLPTDDE